jgi:hypothetical protein
MGPLEKAVTELMDKIVEGAVPMLEATTGEKGVNAPLTERETVLLMETKTLAVKRGVQFLAREMDKTRDS